MMISLKKTYILAVSLLGLTTGFCEHSIKHKMTVYKDLALIDRFEHLPSTKESAYLKNLPKTLYPSTLFLLLKDGSFIESTLEDDDLEKKLRIHCLSDTDATTANLTYAAEKIYWTPYYTVTFSSTCDAIDLHGVFEIDNDTDTTFSNVSFQLIDTPSGLMLNDGSEQSNDLHDDLNPYDIESTFDLHKREKKRISWVDAQNIQTTKEYRLNVGGSFFEDQSNKQVTPQVELWVSCLNKLKPLPKGNMIVYQTMADKHKQALTKMILPTTKLDQIIAFKMPDHLLKSVKHPFQVTYEQTEFQRFTGKLVETANRITVQNTSEQPVVIKIMAKFPSKEGVILRESIPHQNLSDDEFYWIVELSPKDKTELRYRLRFAQES